MPANPYAPTSSPYNPEPPQEQGTPDDLMDGPTGDNRMLDLEPPKIEGNPTTSRPRQKPTGGGATEMAAVTQASRRNEMDAVDIICRGCKKLGTFTLDFVASLADPGVEAACEDCGSTDLDIATEADLATEANNTIGNIKCEVCGKGLAMSTTRGWVHWQEQTPYSMVPYEHMAQPPKTASKQAFNDGISQNMGSTPSAACNKAHHSECKGTVAPDPERGNIVPGEGSCSCDCHSSWNRGASKTADFGGLSTDTGMDTITPFSEQPAVQQHYRCSSCLSEFDATAHDPADLPPACPSCSSVATAIFPKATPVMASAKCPECSHEWDAHTPGDGCEVRSKDGQVGERCSCRQSPPTTARLHNVLVQQARLVQATDFPSSGASGFVAWLQAAWRDLKTGGGDIPSWFPDSLLTPEEQKSRRWMGGGTSTEYAFASRQATVADRVETKIAEITAGILTTNPSMSRDAARGLAAEVLVRYPKLAGASEWKGDACPKCGKNNHANAETCAHCGASLGAKGWNAQA